mmetsp:Transcript_46380/g.105781  ORF Transcript_46380/g.105781 Transcript_46380/m.105781 type:complete len:92 (-) Transcript_46380:108-383(-)
MSFASAPSSCTSAASSAMDLLTQALQQHEMRMSESVAKITAAAAEVGCPDSMEAMTAARPKVPVLPLKFASEGAAAVNKAFSLGVVGAPQF